MTTLDDKNNRDRALKCIALLMEIIRDETGTEHRLEFNGNLATLRRLPPERTATEIARAALWFAQHRTSQRTPAMLSEDGRHWHLDATDDSGVVLPPKPAILTEPMPNPLPPETIAAYTDQIRSNR